MRSITHYSICAFLLISGLMGCNSGEPSTPPTFVLAWNAANGSIRTAESTDGTSWQMGQNAEQATTTSGSLGPAIAHDGNLTWMLMWVNGPELQYKVGIGGSTGTEFINWEGSFNRISNLVPAGSTSAAIPNASPALAHGNDRWVAVSRSAGGALFVVRSRENSATSWEAPVALTHAGSPPVAAFSSRAPALAFGNFAGQRLFVVVYLDASSQAVAATSPDGLTWSPAVDLGPAEKDPALTAHGGQLYALLTKLVSFTGAGASYHGFLLKSCDATNWSEISSYPATANNTTGPGMAFGACRLVVSEQIGGALGGSFNAISARIGTATGTCADPAGFTIGGDTPVTAGLTQAGTDGDSVGHSGARTALAFGETIDSSAAIPACATSPPPPPPKLLITEWFPDKVELHLDAPPGTMLDLWPYFLQVQARTPPPNAGIHSGQVDLFGPMTGGGFLIVFEEPGYSGSPVGETYTDPQTQTQSPGIKVADGFFGWNFGGDSTSLELLRSPTRPSGVLEPVDAVMLGENLPRPPISGDFTEDTPIDLPDGAFLGSLSRKWGPNAPIDNDLESDWKVAQRSFGSSTP